MKTTFAAFALAAALAQPASAITFPTLTTIYVGSGVQDTTGSLATTATAVSCSNVSGVTASVRVLFLQASGAVAAQTTVTLVHGATVNFTTGEVNAIFHFPLTTGQITGGVVNIESTQSDMFCTASIMDTETSGPNGVALHLVRVNPHPGTVE